MVIHIAAVALILGGQPNCIIEMIDTNHFLPSGCIAYSG